MKSEPPQHRPREDLEQEDDDEEVGSLITREMISDTVRSLRKAGHPMFQDKQHELVPYEDVAPEHRRRDVSLITREMISDTVRSLRKAGHPMFQDK